MYIYVFFNSLFYLKIFIKNLLLPRTVLGAGNIIGTKISALIEFTFYICLSLNIKLYRHSMNVSLCVLTLFWNFPMHSA